MFKKLLGIVLALSMAMTLFVGCDLVEENTEAIMSQPVAIIEPISMTYTDADGAEHTFTSERRVITKYELVSYFNNLAPTYLQYYSARDLYNQCFTTLLNRELLLVQVAYEKAVGHISEPTVKQQNDAWKEIYGQLDSLIYTRMAAIADDYDLEAPVEPGTGTNSDPTYPDRVYPDAETEEVEEEPWAPSARYYPSCLAGSPADAELTEDDKLWLQATRDVIGNVIDVIDGQAFLLTAEEKERLEEDKEKFKEIERKKLTDPAITGSEDGTVGVYASMKEYFAVQYMFYESYRDSADLDNLENWVKSEATEQDPDGQITVTDNEVYAEYNRLYGEQFASFGTDPSDTALRSNYTSAIDGGNDLILYRPYDVGQYYVKHILVPFSDEQTAQFSSSSTDSAVKDKTAEQLAATRNALAAQITGYAHKDGYDDTSRVYTIREIRAEINEAMGGCAGRPALADERFTDLIFKFNTDPGIFNNATGYGLRYGEDSSYMPEFEEACEALYEDYLDKGNAAIGTIRECVTDYGVHFIMLSSVLGCSDLSIGSYTDVTMTETVRDHIYKSLLETKQNNAFSSYQTRLLNTMQNSWGSSIKKYPERFEDLIKQYDD